MWEGVTYVEPSGRPVIHEGSVAHAVVLNAGPAHVDLCVWNERTSDRDRQPTPSGFPPTVNAYGKPDTNTRVIVAITGDLTERCKDIEFADAEAFVHDCTTSMILGWKLSADDVFVVPGNHDLQWGEQTP